MWALEQSDADVQARTFGAVEFVFTQDSMRDGNDEAVEFFETVAVGLREKPDTFDRVRSVWGESTRQWFIRWGPHYGFSPPD